jgi:hypothetical protein
MDRRASSRRHDPGSKERNGTKPKNVNIRDRSKIFSTTTTTAESLEAAKNPVKGD